ncbi:dihydrodipicolinate synthase family protein [Gracilibacillus caseinilyticus]|uniref:Dihydrodipicolinate synthase family protein n=1 Tax=Gracilibacillus caseinilyticus TaxID=2932256 RepID=A0ABY4EWW6_9BACI|nr:dihydrodipicolinate synthase family protein [Gracilibacillus caseinilyticus]UOQ48765.1 dihydrodipicolinate synthase family protein [Gracilibacillus caseinilyticus]
MLKETFHIAVPTAFFDDESLNVQGTIEYINHLYKQGIKSVLVSGSTGEQHSLNLREKIELVKSLEVECDLMNNMEIIFGVSSIRQKEAEELAMAISNTKISGILLGYSPYVLPTQEEALVYTKTIINYSNKPTILYNNPKRTGFDLSVTSIAELSSIDLVVGLKEAGDKAKIRLLKKEINRNNFHYYAGGELELEEKVLQGFDRLSSIAGNISPLEIRNYFQKLLVKETISEQERANIEVIFQQVNQGSPIVNLKKVLNQNGFKMGVCRKPIGNV